MTARHRHSWTIGRSLALLAATFAIVLGALLPYAAMAAAVPGHPIILCSAEGPRTVQAGGATERDPDGSLLEADCAACVVPMAATLPPPVLAPDPPAVRTASQVAVSRRARVQPPARAPPRPPSTAPPHA